MHGECDYSIAGVQACYTASVMKLSHYGKKPEYPVACCRDNWQAGYGGGNPHTGFFLGRRPAACCGVLHFGRTLKIEGKRNLNVGVLYYKKYIADGRAN